MDWACVLLPQLALDSVLRRHPTPEAPLALIEGPAQRRSLHSVNAAARALGWRPGLSLATAQALGGEVALVEYDAAASERMRQFLAAWAYRYSSQVSTEFAHALVLEVGRSQRLFGPWPRLQAQLRADLAELGVRARLAAAPNPYAARMLANVDDGLAIDHGHLQQALGRLPIDRAGLARSDAAALSRMGLRELRQLFALPRDTVARRFPAALLEHCDLLRGLRQRPLPYYQPPDHFDARIEFEQEVESSQALLFPLRRLTADLAAYLAGRDGGVQRFLLRLEHEQLADSEVWVGLLAAEREAGMLFELARGRIEQARLPAAVRGLRLQARELPAFVPAGRDLFDTRPQQAVPWSQLRERLRARLGDDSVQGLGVRADHRPERASGEGGAKSSTPPAVERPGWLLARPIPLRERIQRVLAGPERIETGWWDGDDVRRDYYRVETSSGQQAWVFCAPGEAGPYMLHGWFA